jgi:hypothetical protein
MAPNNLIYTGKAETVELRGPVSQILEIPWHATTRIQWAPTDRRVTPLEIRVSVTSWKDDVFSRSSIDTNGPTVRMRLTFGHGQQTLYDPAMSSPLNDIVTPLPVAAHPIPARGFLGRISAREVSIDLTFSENQRPSVTVSVSVQPVDSMVLPCIGRMGMCPGIVGLVPPPGAEFPAWAHEWKVFDRAGLPFEPGQKTLALYGMQGFFQVPSTDPDLPGDVTEIFDASDFADWTPIGLKAFGWQASNLVMAAYR